MPCNGVGRRFSLLEIPLGGVPSPTPQAVGARALGSSHRLGGLVLVVLGQKVVQLGALTAATYIDVFYMKIVLCYEKSFTVFYSELDSMTEKISLFKMR